MIASILAHRQLALTVMLLVLCATSAIASDQTVVKGHAVARDSAGPLAREAILLAAATVAHLTSWAVELCDAFSRMTGAFG
jgi:hypothetical protein